MRVTVERGVVHRCPYADELDIGTLHASWEGEGIELHAFSQYLDTWAVEPVTHERMTEGIAEHLNQEADDVRVATSWTTAGMTVTVTA